MPVRAVIAVWSNRCNAVRPCRTGLAWVVGSLLPLCALATAAPPVLPSVLVYPDGVGAFRLGVPLLQAARQMARQDPAALLIGPGCDERDQSTVSVSVAGRAMTVMAMADARGRIAEVVASAPHQGPAMSEARCQAQAQQWATALNQRLGRAELLPTVAQGAARTSSMQWSAGARLDARYFLGGQSCDLSLHHGQPRQLPAPSR